MVRFAVSFTVGKNDGNAGPLVILGLAAVVDDDRVALTKAGWRLAAAPSPLLEESGSGTLSGEERDIFTEQIGAASGECAAVIEFLELVVQANGSQPQVDRMLGAHYGEWSGNRTTAHRAAIVGRLAELSMLSAAGRGGGRAASGPARREAIPPRTQLNQCHGTLGRSSGGLMTRRCLVCSLTALALVALASSLVTAQDVPLTPSGRPDLQGVWDFRTITPMQRPEERAEQAFLTDEEAANLDQEAADREVNLGNRPAKRTEVDPSGNVDRGVDGAPGSYNSFWFDRGTSVVGTKRTSLVTDPPNGRIPELTPTAERKRAAMAEARKDTGTHEPTPGGWVDDLGANGCRRVALSGSTPDRR